MKTKFGYAFFLSSLIMITGCSSTVMQTKVKLSNVSAHKENISLFALKNYTDTPQAGMRAANILDGLLLAKGYNILSHIQEGDKSLNEMREIALKENAKYFISGGVSEWRYKTGIDGEPAVSFKCVLYDTQTTKVMWSATASDSAWGSGSIGTTAQSLLDSAIGN